MTARAQQCGSCGSTRSAAYVTLWPSRGDDSPLRDGLLAESRERIERRALEPPAVGELQLEVAERLFAERRLHEALYALDVAVAAAPQQFRVRLRRAECLAAVGRYRNALVELERARLLPADDLRSIAYYHELTRWVGERATQTHLRRTPRARPVRISWRAALADVHRRLAGGRTTEVRIALPELP
jgi:tetratricopeptide (TPR) repeat protein